jgi:NAD(P)H dehydrogenase (quinone)
MAASVQRIVAITCGNSNNAVEAAKALKSSGQRVRLLVRDPSKHENLKQYGEVVKGDFGDEATLKEAFKGVSALYLVSPMIMGVDEQNERTLKVAKETGTIDTVVYLSAVGAAKGASLWVANSHGIREEQVKQSGITNWTILQPTWFQSNLWVYNAQTIKEQGKMYGSAGEGKFTPIAVKDIGEVAAKIFSNPSAFKGQTLLLTGGESFTSAEVCSLASKVWGRPVEYVDVLPEPYRKTLDGYGMPDWQASTLVGLEQFKRSGNANILDPTVEKVLGRKPTTLEQELKENKID